MNRIMKRSLIVITKEDMMKGTMVFLTLLMWVASAWAGTARYDFSDENQFNEWQLSEDGPGDPTKVQWYVENGELVGVSEGICGWATGPGIGDETWHASTFEFQFLIEETYPFVPAEGTCDSFSSSGLLGFVNFRPGDDISPISNTGKLIWSGPHDLDADGIYDFNFAGKDLVGDWPFGEIAPVEVGKWHTWKMVADGNHWQMFIDDQLVGEVEDDAPGSGIAGLAIRNNKVRFDNVVITGDGIPSRVTADDPEVLKALVRRHIEETWNKHNPDFHDETTDPNAVWHQRSGEDIIGIEAVKETAAGTLAVIPDTHLTIDDLIAEGDTAAARFTFSGAFTPTELSFEVTGAIFYRFVDGPFTEIWDNYDELGLQRQVGLLPPPEEGDAQPTEPPAEILVGERPRDETPDDPEVIRAMVRRYIEETWNKHNPDFHDEIADPNVVWHRSLGDIIGIEAVKETVAGNLAVIPDMHVTIDNLIVEGDTAAALLHLAGPLRPPNCRLR